MKKRICIIGNSPNALNKKDADFINSSLHVVRFNNYVTAGYEECIGERTTLWATCNWKVKMREISEFQHVLLVNNVGLHKKKGWLKSYTDLMALQSLEKGTYLHHMDVFTIQQINQEVASKFSAGIAAIFFCKKHFPDTEIYLKGFSGFQEREHHYMKDRGRPKGCPHSGKKEIAWIEKQVEAQSLKLI